MGGQPERDVGHEGDVAVGVDGRSIAGHDSRAVNIGVHHDAEISVGRIDCAHTRDHGRLVLRVGHMVGEPAVWVQVLAACATPEPCTS